LIVADTGGVFALYAADDRHHRAVLDVLESSNEPIVVPLPVVAELDYLFERHLGPSAMIDFLESLESGAFALDRLQLPDLERIRGVLTEYRDLRLGFVDASVLVVAERLRTTRILTVDLRDFRAVGRHRHGTLELLPADAS
jgi:predicted nucleic acid-binding protein